MLAQRFLEILKDEFPQKLVDFERLLETPKGGQADLALPCFELREKTESPQAAAIRITEELRLGGALEVAGVSVQAQGPYVNFTFSSDFLANILSSPQRLKSNGKKLVLDYSSPNIGKPFGIGHLRSTVIGASIKATYEFLGWKVIGINHIGDWGTQFGNLIVAYKRWGENDSLQENAVEKLYSLYVRFHNELEQRPELEEEGREWFAKLERGDAEARKLWTLFREKSLSEFEKLYAKLGIHFEHVLGESFYEDKMDRVVEEMRTKSLLTLDEGAWIVDFPAHGRADLTPAILIKSNKTTTYVLRDVTSLLYRYQNFHFNMAVYEVGAEQNLHFKQVFAIAELLGYDFRCEHVSHGLYVFPEGKMSTRKGNIIFIEDVIEQATSKGRDIIAQKNPELANREHVAQTVALAALVFQDLRTDRVKTVTFSWDKMLDFEGETGPYVLYGYARIASILRKARVTPVSRVEQLRTTEELALAKHILRFNDAVEQAATQFKPHILCRYVLDLVQLFNTFYVQHKVIHEDDLVRKDRLALVHMVQQTMAVSCALLHISMLEEM